MKRLMALFLIGFVVLASGCMGDQAGLTEEKVLEALQSIETASYDQNFSMSMHFTDPYTNKTINFTMSGRSVGVFNNTAGLEKGNMSITMHMMGMDVNMDWPYFVNNSSVYFMVDGKWYNVSPDDDLYSQARGSLNVDYIRNLLNEKNVTIEKLADGYAFRVNVTFWEFANATNQTGYLNELWSVDGERGVNVTTNSGWVEVHLTKDGMPTFIETHMYLIMTIKNYSGETTDIHMILHETVALSNINEPVEIKASEGIKNAGDFEEIFW
ncbi:hypothetical protein GQS_03890 [Thermococcus sp. 4557]|uniref:hypothetical protein n=1 Tax=Thermococcus sp. (strain CGMCC 1.5172 / 4557) TaxID=1042877 RepID=UPI000219E981|nr:hypothetical protein [Thermococcus sp. 4557]AEK72679.1 hypothetical protein GQS_03890 [Thermococcus sp. 4557]